MNNSTTQSLLPPLIAYSTVAGYKMMGWGNKIDLKEKGLCRSACTTTN